MEMKRYLSRLVAFVSFGVVLSAFSPLLILADIPEDVLERKHLSSIVVHNRTNKTVTVKHEESHEEAKIRGGKEHMFADRDIPRVGHLAMDCDPKIFGVATLSMFINGERAGRIEYKTSDVDECSIIYDSPHFVIKEGSTGPSIEFEEMKSRALEGLPRGRN